MNIQIRCLVLGLFLCLVSAPVDLSAAETPAQFNSVHLIGSVNNEFTKEFRREPAAIAQYSEFWSHFTARKPSPEFEYAGLVKSGHKGLKASVNSQRMGITGENRSDDNKGSAYLTDEILVMDKDCNVEFKAVEREVEFVCPDTDSEIELFISPIIESHAEVTIEVGAPENEGAWAEAWAKKRVEVLYGGTKSAWASHWFCIRREYGSETVQPCDGSRETGQEHSGNLQQTPDTTPDNKASVDYKLEGTELLKVTIPKSKNINGIEPVGRFNIMFVLKAETDVRGEGFSGAFSQVHAWDTLSYAKSGNVFNVPDGFTVWSTSGLIQNNQWVNPALTLSNDSGINGVYFDPTNPGHGFDLNVHELGLTMFYYGHTQSRERLWLVGNYADDLEFGLPITMDLYEVPDGTFGIPGSLQIPAPPCFECWWGTITITLADCDSGHASFDGIDGLLEMDFVRLVGVQGLGCN